jgi:hypothetical protein
LFTTVLQAHVRDGAVDYRALRVDDRFDGYLAQLQKSVPDALSDRKARLAFWINAYNAYTLKLIVDHYPVKSINDLSTGGLIIGTIIGRTAWDRDIVRAGQRTMTLNDVEHKILRPVFKDPRVHFAIVCASKSCPPLRSEAYEADRLDAQLDDQARLFLASPQKNHVDIPGKTVYLSPIFSWFQSDFGQSPEEVLRFVARYLDPSLSQAIRADPAKWRIRYTDYDWRLNE